MKYVNVIIDNKSDMTDIGYTYLCDEEFAYIGNMVLVPFGMGNKTIKGCITAVMDDNYEYDKKFKLKRVTSQLDTPLTEEIVRTCEWMRRRYFCRFFDCIELFLPMGKKPVKKVKPVYSEAIEVKNQEYILTFEQENVISQIEEAIDNNKHEVFLLHGVTGSGKTQVYITVIEKLLKKDIEKTAIVLVPEISLTKQVVDRFVEKFGESKIAIMHSKLTKAQRYEQWERIRKGDVKIVIGARSAIFAPLENIGIIVLDEEHETTYKSDKTPKYDTLEVAYIRTQKSNGSIILGSATPSIMAYQRSKENIFKYLKMEKRYNENQLPDVKVVDMSDEIKSGNKTSISRELYKQIQNTTNENKQVILFLNRRGYSTYVSCEACGYRATCEDCDISLIYHKNTNTLDCHYCGKKIKATKKCPSCGEDSMIYRGVGTEKAEEEIKELFPDKVVERLDLDTSQKAGYLEKTLRKFGKGKIDILMGTQIVAKGLDFHNVGLVGVLAADMALNIPDYRASERCFQLITQAAGRAGRGSEKGLVVLQTFNPDNYAINYGVKQDYIGFFNQEITIRKYMEYPPFSDLIQLVFSSQNDNFARIEAGKSRDRLVAILGKDREENIYPVQQMVSITKDTYKYYILMKAPKEEGKIYRGAIKILRDKVIENKKNKVYGKTDVQISVDINPYSIWRG